MAKKPDDTLDGSIKPYVEEGSEHLRCKLDDSERLAHLESVNGTLDSIKKVEDEKALANTGFSSRIKDLTGHLGALRDELENGVVRPVKTKTTYDFGRKVVITRRMDTGEETERPMTDLDKAKAQQALGLDDARRKAEGAGAAH